MAACAVLGAAAIVRTATGSSAAERAAVAPQAASPSAVTAHPPLEAVPATARARTQQSRLRSCTAAARAKHLHGRARETFVRTCVTPRSPARSRPPPASTSR